MRMKPSAILCAILAGALGAGEACAASPSLGSVSPRGGQRGTEITIHLNGARLADAEEVLFYSPGFAVSKLEAVNDGQVKASVKIAPDCRLGEHALRVRTKSGISELRTLYVGALPPLDEVEPNSEFDHPQKAALNVTISGTVTSEDVDYFAVEAKKGQRISFEIEGMRLGGVVFDPYVAILNAKRFELATSDDSALAWQDGAASILAPEDGTYIVQVRESAYGGDGNCLYRLHVGTFPRPLVALPAGGRPGEELEVLLLGDAAGEIRQKVKLPDAPTPGFGIFPEDSQGIAPSPLLLRVSPFGNTLEVEPNETHEQATRAPEAPAAFHGIISKPGDVDCFRFAAKKGQTFDVHLFGRRIRSPLDGVLTISHAGGGGIAGNDDAIGPDSYFRFTAPEDKEYVLQVTDHLGKGGPTHAYRLELQPVAPRLAMSIPKVSLFSQERQTIVVPRGNRYATLLQASRSDFGGPVVVDPPGLPQGVSFAAEEMPANLDVVPVVFEAAPDAPLSGALVDLGARHADANQKIRGGFTQTTELTTGGPGQSVYWKYEADRAAVAVTEEAPFKIRIVEPKVPLVQNGSMGLKVQAERKEGFKAPITLQMVFNPPGVGSAGGVAIGEGQSDAVIPMNANGGAEIRTWKIAVLGVATVGNGPVWVSSQLAPLTIAPPFVDFAMEKAAVEQGKETEIFCKLTHRTPFEGPARVEVVGLPPKTATQPLEVTKETKELAFKVKVDPQAPAGTHKNIFCQLVVTQNGEPIPHAVGGTELRIDVPLPPKPNQPPPPPNQPPPPAAEKKPDAPPPKRLTRLEKLRLEQEERSKEAKK